MRQSHMQLVIETAASQCSRLFRLFGLNSIMTYELMRQSHMQLVVETAASQCSDLVCCASYNQTEHQSIIIQNVLFVSLQYLNNSSK